MAAKFLAVGSFLIRSRNLFVIAGDIFEGTVLPGMQIAVKLNHGLAVTTSIRDVEYVDLFHEKRSYVGLAVEYESSEELDFWMSMQISGELLEITAVS